MKNQSDSDKKAQEFKAGELVKVYDENDENKFKIRFEQINMIEVQMREKEEQVKESTSDEKLEINVEQCEVRNFMKEELNVHIRMIHDKGRLVGREDTKEGEGLSTSSEHHAGKQVIGGQHVKNEDGEMKRFVQRFVQKFVQRFVQRMFQWNNGIRWQKRRPREI